MAQPYTVSERSSATYTATLLDESGAPVAAAALDSLRMWLRDVNTGTIINSRENQDVLNTNNVTVHATSGLVTWQSVPADHPIVGSRTIEEHEAVFRATWSSGTRAKTWRVRIEVSNLAPITT